MTKPRRHHTPEEKVTILRRHLLDKVPISDLGDPYGIHATLFDNWQKQFFENGTAAFAQGGKRRRADSDGKDRQIAALEEKRRRKHEVRSELMEEYVQLTKELGEP